MEPLEQHFIAQLDGSQHLLKQVISQFKHPNMESTTL
jgi:hypothetical protein